MQQGEIDATELVTPAAYAKSRKLNRSTISKQITEGKIPVHDGLVNPAEADEARDKNLADNHKRKHTAPVEMPSEFIRGVECAAIKFVTAARLTWPKMVAAMDFAVIPEESRIGAKGLFTLLMARLAEGWAGQFVDVDRLPAMDYGVFGEDAAAVRQECEALLAEWRTDPK